MCVRCLVSYVEKRLVLAGKLKGNVTLRVFHEVMVLEPEQQMFEYVACHPGTGMLVTC